jgi:MFS family permease
MPNADVTISHALAKPPVVQSWEPLRHARFRRLWVANLIANLGNGIHAFAVAWLIATISHAPSTAAMVQTLAYAPLLLFALPAGVIADVVCRPKVLFLANLLMAICSGGCFILVTTLDLDATLVPVLALTFVHGAGAALRWPAWQAYMCDLVPPRELEAVALLENISLNAGAVGGPLVANLLFAWGGGAAPFVASVFALSGTLALFWAGWKKGPDRKSDGWPSWPAMAGGLGAAVSSSRYRAILLRAAGVYFVLIAFAALLPVYVRDVVQRGSDIYAIFCASLGAGAALAAFLLPALRKRAGHRCVFIAGLSSFGLMMVLLPLTRSITVLGILIFVAGIAWCSIISTMLTAAQATFPAELRARALSLYLLVMAAAFTLGSMFWGALADREGAASSVIAAGCASIINAIFILCSKNSTVRK